MNIYDRYSTIMMKPLGNKRKCQHIKNTLNREFYKKQSNSAIPIKRNQP